MPKVLHVFNTINRLRERYYVASVGKQSLIKLLSEAEVAEQVYNSNAIENSSLVLAERKGGHFVFHWPKQFRVGQEISDQLAVYWTPMPGVRQGLLLAGLLVIPLLNSLAALAGRLGGPQIQLSPAAAPARRRGLTVGPQRV